MNKDDQIIEISKALGFTNVYLCGSGHAFNEVAVRADWISDQIGTVRRIKMEDYPNDLNAMHKAEKTLTHQQEFVYHDELHKLCKSGSRHPCYESMRASAAKRAEAFLKTIGKWEE